MDILTDIMFQEMKMKLQEFRRNYKTTQEIRVEKLLQEDDDSYKKEVYKYLIDETSNQTHIIEPS